MTDRIRVGVAGLGAVAQSVHLPLLARRWDLFELVGICDLSPSLRETLGEHYGVPVSDRYANVHDLLADAEIDGLVLLTSGSHGAAALASLRSGVPVLCEKPLAYTAAEADQLAAAADADGPSLLLAYMKERDDAVARLGELLTGMDGVRAVEVRVLHPSSTSQLAFANLRPPPADVPADQLTWLHESETILLDAALGAGTPDRFRRLYASVVVGSMVHDISLLRRLLAGLVDVDDVRVWPDDAFPPSVEVSGTLAGGARARLTWHYLENYPAYRETVAVHHDRGSLQVSFGTPYLLNAPSELEVFEAGLGGEVRSTYRSKGDAFENELVEFHRMVTEDAAPQAGIAEGRADIITSQRVMRRFAEQQGIEIGGEAARTGSSIT